MTRHLRLVTGMALFLLLLAGCRAGAQAKTATAPTATPAAQDASRYWELVQQAQKAYAATDFAAAADLARKAAGLQPDENTAWELYRQAIIAQAGDAYLSQLPPHRYRLPVDVFLRDQVNKTKDWFIIDVREPEEYAAGHIQGAVNFPLREFMRHLDELPSSKTAPILLYCHTQKRATHALVVLHELGYIKAFNLEGGYAAYEEWITTQPLPTPGPTPTPGPEERDFGC